MFGIMKCYDSKRILKINEIIRTLFFLFVSVVIFSCDKETNSVSNNAVNNNNISNPPAEETTVKDHEGNEYPIKKIGKYTWTTENMKCTTLKDGTSILSTSTNYSSFQDPVGYHTYLGNLYNLHAAEQICPDGWHLPSQQEWGNLFANSGAYVAKSVASKNGWAQSNVDYTPGNVPSANNTSGFNALPIGFIMNSENAQNKGAYFWASGIHANGYDGTLIYIYYNEVDNKSRNMNLDVGAAVRCVKN